MMVDGGRKIDGNRYQPRMGATADGPTRRHRSAPTCPPSGSRWTPASPTSPTGNRCSTASSLPRWTAREQARRRLPGLQRPLHRLRRELIPTFALGHRGPVQARRRRLGAAAGAGVSETPKLASHIAQTVILDEFDLTIMNEMEVDHGLTVPLSLMFGTSRKTLGVSGRSRSRSTSCNTRPRPRTLLHARPGDPARDRQLPRTLNVHIYGTGGMSHQLQAARRADQRRVGPRLHGQLVTDPGRAPISHLEFLRETGSEGIEMVMWLVPCAMRRSTGTSPRSTATTTCPRGTPPWGT